MPIEDYERIGQQAADDVLSSRYTLLAERLGYALAFDRVRTAAIQEDFELAVSETGGDSENATCSISVKKFIDCEPEFIALIEVEITLLGGIGVVLVEIIQNVQGFYLEQISFLPDL